MYGGIATQCRWAIWNPTSKNNGNIMNGYYNIKTNTSAFSATRKREKRLNCFVEFDFIRFHSWPSSLTLWHQILRWFVTFWIRYGTDPCQSQEEPKICRKDMTTQTHQLSGWNQTPVHWSLFLMDCRKHWCVERREAPPRLLTAS